MELVISMNLLLLEQLARDEKTGKVMNMVFVWAEEGSTLEVDVPIVFKGEDSCPGLKKGLFYLLAFSRRICFWFDVIQSYIIQYASNCSFLYHYSVQFFDL